MYAGINDTKMAASFASLVKETSLDVAGQTIGNITCREVVKEGNFLAEKAAKVILAHASDQTFAKQTEAASMDEDGEEVGDGNVHNEYDFGVHARLQITHVLILGLGTRSCVKLVDQLSEQHPKEREGHACSHGCQDSDDQVEDIEFGWIRFDQETQIPVAFTRCRFCRMQFLFYMLRGQ
ncbi:MAG: hypothetical protein Q9226_009258 [Calogaya cf. arnoldii]